ncbi:MAG: glycoside hydrolase family 2 TIM barrel-domain containing protein [Bacillota bacterium]|nr:glycoside hydrolase family 2 TIM barrel-domain containing protein [Bacillota bacterium]
MIKKLFNDGWKFSKQKLDTPPEMLDQDGIEWLDIDLPHDWLIYDTNNLYEASEGWYKKTFVPESIGDKVISIRFEGVYMDSTVFVNGKKAGEWKYGYSTFEFDITEHLVPGENEIKVRVVYRSPNSRWYSGAGIYRNVWLIATEPAHFVSDGIYISAKKGAEGWKVEVDAEIIDESDKYGDVAGENQDAVVRHTIIDADGNVTAVCEQKAALRHDTVVDSQVLTVGDPRLWSLEDPYLYKLKSELIVEGQVKDTVLQNFGFRTLRFDCNEGFFLNDVHVKLHGTCEHHDLGALGAAMNKTALRRQITMLKEMGVNSIRTSHNMPAVELMDLADEMGVLIVSEAFDMWERSKTEYDYARFFNEWCERDVASWVRRDRNHPSIIMWSIGNEIYDTHADERGLEITKMLRDLVKKHDPKQNGYVTIGSNYMRWDNAQRCMEEVEVAGYNYAESLYHEHHKKYPHWVIYGSETASTLQSRGIYHFPADVVVMTHEDEQCSSLDNCTTAWGAKNAQYNIIEDRDAKFCLGQYIWTGFDYIGEPTPYFTKNSYFGQIDTAGFRKDNFYLYQSAWTDYKTNPMVHILPYWDFNEGQLIDVIVYSNAPKVELFFNDGSLGTAEIDHVKGKQLSGKWRIPYRKGVLKAVAYDEDGRIIATDTQSSFGDAARIVLSPDKTVMKADGLDMIFVEISMADKDGIPVANANNRVEVTVSGAGRLVGLDNGDSTDFDQYKGTSRRLFSGKLLAMVAAKQEPGQIRFSVSSPGLGTEELVFEAVPCEKIPGVSAFTENKKSEPVNEIPIRKIELFNHGKNHLDKDNPTTRVTAVLRPGNATYDEIEWKAVTSHGIVTNIAKVETSGKGAVVTALADGEFRLRCIARNGRKLPQVISELEFEISGFGDTVMDPYEFIPAGLYNASTTTFKSGLLGGVQIADEEIAYVGFRGIDFGEYGSDEITIPIYFLGDDRIPIEIWEGVPGEEDAEPLLRTTYQKKCIYLTYQAETYKLPRRLKGITTLSIGGKDMVNIQGFRFTRYEKAYQKLYAIENNRIYGDSYTLTEDAVEKIGNNVALEFENMDFGEEGFSKLVICGRSRNDVNTINIHFVSGDEDIVQIVEVPYSDDCIEHEFNLDSVKGVRKVSFTFLPGSNFDFRWFRFVK